MRYYFIMISHRHARLADIRVFGSSGGGENRRNRRLERAVGDFMGSRANAEDAP